MGKRRKTAGRGRQRNKRKKAQDWHRKWETRKRITHAWDSSRTWRKSQERRRDRNATAARKRGAAGGGASPTRGTERTCAWVHSIFALGN